jgi:hypothetical protein
VIGYDKSEFQAIGADPFGAYEIVRACNGRREDYRVDGHVAAAHSRGVAVSLYAYCEPGGMSPEDTAGLLVGVAQRVGIPKSTVLWADIEEGSGDLRWYEDRFVACVNQAGWPCGVYSGDSFWGAHNLGGAQGRWKAAYGPNDGGQHSAPQSPWDVWQYTSQPLDTNTADSAVVARLFGGGSFEEDDLPYTPEQVTQFSASGTERALDGPAATVRIQTLVQGEIRNMVANDPDTRNALKSTVLEALRDTNLNAVIIQALKDAGLVK